MSTQILEITQPGYMLKIKRGFVQVFDGKELLGEVVIDDLLCLLISVPGCLISSNLIDRLVNEQVPIAICGKNYLPNALILPTAGKGRQYEIMRAQSALSEPKRKRFWQTVVQAKLFNQASLLEQLGINAIGLHKLITKTRSGDLDNCEAQGARYYWTKLFGAEFRRNRDANDINSALNYSYTVLRACMARAIVASGLHPTYSLHHRNPQNPINLVDDLMEPFRPVCDAIVNLHRHNQFDNGLSTELKRRLANVAIAPVISADETSPLSIACVKLARSFANSLLDKTQLLEFPRLSSQIEMSAN